MLETGGFLAVFVVSTDSSLGFCHRTQCALCVLWRLADFDCFPVDGLMEVWADWQVDCQKLIHWDLGLLTFLTWVSFMFQGVAGGFLWLIQIEIGHSRKLDRRTVLFILQYEQ